MGHPFQKQLFFNTPFFVFSWFQSKFGGLCAVMAILGLTEVSFWSSFSAWEASAVPWDPSLLGAEGISPEGTQTIPCFFKMESIERKMLICSSGNDLISGDSAGLRWLVCCGFSNLRSSDQAEKMGNVCGQVLALLSCAEQEPLSGCTNSLKAVKKPNFLVKQSPLFFQFTWQRLRQILVNTLFHCQRGWCLSPPQATHCYRVIFSPPVLVLLPFLPGEVYQHDITFIWYLNGCSGVCNDILLLCEDDVSEMRHCNQNRWC